MTARRDLAYTGDDLRRARLRAGLSVTELARRVGLPDRRSATRWERDGIPRNSHYLDGIERALRLGRHETQAGVAASPGDLPEGALWARVLGDLAELQRRYWAKDPPRHMHGQPVAYPTHLDGEGHPHDRSESHS